MADAPNYRRGIGRLVTDRYDFQAHLDGYPFQHKANQILMNPPLRIPSPSGPAQTTVQAALTAALPYLAPPSIPDADTSGTKGVITLQGGDLAGSGSTATSVKVSGIQGFPISTLPPTAGKVLMWDGSSWKPTALSVVTFYGDLTGSYVNQQVIGLTGDISGVVTSNARAINFVSTVVPVITQAANSSSGNNLTIGAQDSTLAAGRAGSVVISGGADAQTNGFHGGVQLKMARSTWTMLDITELAVNPSDPHRRILSLLHGSGIVNTTNMPNNTGDMVIFIADAVTAPTSGVPVGGTILYSSGGKLKIKEAGGNYFTISDPNLAPNRIIYNLTVSKPFDLGDTSHFYQTNATSWQWVTPTFEFNLNSPWITAGDKINVSFSGSVQATNISWGSMIRLAIDFGSGASEIPGTTTILSSGAFYNDQLPIALSGMLVAGTGSSNTRIGVQVYTFSSANYIQLYKGLSLTVMVVRPA